MKHPDGPVGLLLPGDSLVGFTDDRMIDLSSARRFPTLLDARGNAEVVRGYSESLFSRTLKHPVLASFIEFVPTDWLLSMANPTPSPTTNLEFGDDHRVGWDELFDNMLACGMRDPFIVGVGRATRTARLEAGNQRIRCMHSRRIATVPAVAYVSDSAVTCLENGSHLGLELPLRLDCPEISMEPYPIKMFAKLSDVLCEMPVCGEST